MDVEEKIAESNCKSYEWELYKLVNARTEHLHTRWIDNYRIFLSFNAVLGAAVTAIFGLLIKEDSNVLRVVLLSLCVFGILATCQGLGLILRVHIEMKLRIDELLRLERMISQLPIRIYEEGRQFLYENKDVGNVLQKENPRKGRGVVGIHGFDKGKGYFGQEPPLRAAKSLGFGCGPCCQAGPAFAG